MAALPASIALTTIADGAQAVAADHRNNFASVQTALNALIAILAGGASGQMLQSGGGTTVAWGGTYADYTPTWAASGAAPVIGNGTLNARYAQVGKLVHYFGQLVMGSTTTFGTGNYSLSLPVNRSGVGNASGRVHGLVELSDSSAGAQGLGIADTAASVSAFAPFFAATYLGARTQVGQTVPWAWAVGDFLVWNLIYEGV